MFLFCWYYYESSQTLEHGAQRRGISISGDIQKLSGHSPGQPARGDPNWAWGLTRWSQEAPPATAMLWFG